MIRGQADNRIRVLNNGTEVFDVSNLSPDHAPSVSPLLSQSIEVVRGPATILFGSGAIGGVVNVSDTVIPVEQPSTALSGEVDGRFNSADLERSGAISLTLSPAKHWVFHGQFSFLRTDDRRIPGFALDERIRAGLTPAQAAGREFGENPEGTVPNTFVKTKDYAFGLSYVWDKGYVGASFTEFLSVYGVPDDPEVDDPTMPPLLILAMRRVTSAGVSWSALVLSASAARAAGRSRQRVSQALRFGTADKSMSMARLMMAATLRSATVKLSPSR